MATSTDRGRARSDGRSTRPDPPAHRSTDASTRRPRPAPRIVRSAVDAVASSTIGILSPVRRTLTSARNRRAGLNPAPVFVLGNQKSGTTAIAALLAECAGLDFFHDTLYRRKLRLRDLLDENPSLGDFARGAPELFSAGVIKDNDFTFLIPELERTFPEARLVYVVRDPRDNTRSVLNRLQYSGAMDELPDDELEDLRQRLPGWYEILTGASFGPPGGQYIDVLAERWTRAARAYLDRPDRMTLVRYEDFDADKRATIERLARTLGQPVVTDITASQDRQFQPRGDREVRWDDFFGANLERIDDICGPYLERFGYRRSTAA